MSSFDAKTQRLLEQASLGTHIDPRDARIRELEAQVAKANRRYESCVKTLKFANDGWVETIGERDNWRKIAEGLAGKLSRLHDDCCVTYKERLDVGPMFAPSEIAVLDAREALSTYIKAKAEEGL